MDRPRDERPVGPEPAVIAAARSLLPASAGAQGATAVDVAMVARIREEGLQHSRVMDFEGYIAEPFMDFGVSWDNEYVALHMLEPDYSPMVGYPIAHTPGTNGRQVADAVIVELASRDDLAKYRGTLKGKAVLVTPPVAIDLASLTNGVPRLTPQDLERLEQTVIAPPRPAPARPVPNPNVLSADERMAFYKSDGVAAVLQSESGWLGAVRGFSRPGSVTR